MSGGSWDYLTFRVGEAADRLYNSKDALRKALGVHLHLVAEALHDIEWVDSGDMSNGDEKEAILRVIQKEDWLSVLVEDATKIRDQLSELIKEID